MRKTDALLYGVMGVGFIVIGWTAWAEFPPTFSSQPTAASVSAVAREAKAGARAEKVPPPPVSVQGRRGDPRPMYEYRVVRIPRLMGDDDDARRHERMMAISYKLCYGFVPFYGFEEAAGFYYYRSAQNDLNERDAEELGEEGLRLYRGVFSALCEWDAQMWEVATFKYAFGAHGPERPTEGAKARSAEALSLMLEGIGDDSLAEALRHPRVMGFDAAKARIAKLMPDQPTAPEYALTAKDHKDFAELRTRLLTLTDQLGKAAACLPPQQQEALNDLLLEKLTAFDQR